MVNMDNMTFFLSRGRVPEILVHSTFSVPGSIPGVPPRLILVDPGVYALTSPPRDEAPATQRSQIGRRHP